MSMPTREEMIVEKIAPYLDASQTVLEIGAGNGLTAEMLQYHTSAQFTLLDVVDYNRSRLPLKLYDGKTLPFEENVFDVALLVFVLHHTPDPCTILREALRVTRRGVLVMENDTRGAIKRLATLGLDNIEPLRRGSPRCYFTKSADEWQTLFQEIPARGKLLETFALDWFWHNAIFRVEK